MKLAYNFISVVAVGNFNPSIITPSFLEEECKLQFGEPVEISPPEMPVHRRIKFKNIAFDVFINKFVITENNPERIESLLVVDAFQKIFRLLPYTPFNAVGININCDIFFDDGEKAKRWISSASDPQKVLNFYKKPIKVNESYHQDETERRWESSSYKIESYKGLDRAIRFEKKKKSFLLNYNCEANRLGKDKSKIDFLFNYHSELIIEFNDFMERFQE